MTKSKAKTINSDNTAKTTKLAVTAMLAALSAVLMFFEFPLGFIAPSFYEFDFSEVPVLVGTFSMGPIAGVVIEFVKILVKFLIKGTSTGGVGELANFLIGCSFILPAGFIYKYKKSKSRCDCRNAYGYGCNGGNRCGSQHIRACSALLVIYAAYRNYQNGTGNFPCN
mgnify:FL=1